MKVFSAALALLASSSAPVFAAESTQLRAQQDDTAARDLAAGGNGPNAPVDPFLQLTGTYMGSTSLQPSSAEYSLVGAPRMKPDVGRVDTLRRRIPSDPLIATYVARPSKY